MRIAVIGGVNSTRVLIEKLFEYGYRDVHVWGYAPRSVELVSGWADLAAPCQAFGFDYTPFIKVVDCEEAIAAYSPDLLFAVGLSQLLPKSIIKLPQYGCAGFHPTALPKGRGRAAIAWLILEQVDGAASFFTIREGVDDGPLLAQEPFSVNEQDDAGSVEMKILSAEARALDNLLPELANNLEGAEQDHTLATWYGRRSPEDGWINWAESRDAVIRLIKASTIPHPGAFTFIEEKTIRIWAAEPVDIRHKGVVGRIIEVAPNEAFIVQCGSGLVRVTSWDVADGAGWSPKVGQRLGFYTEIEIQGLLKKNTDLESRISDLENTVSLLASKLEA